ncbi:MAG: HEAT repeat domain-containing protein [Polyangiaceae bacterium]|jgi:HEAT repeat protein
MNPRSHASDVDDRQRTSEIERLGQLGAVDALIERLSDRTWTVRRSAVAALARLGAGALDSLCNVLAHRRDDEDRLASAVDALVGSLGDVDDSVLSLLGSQNPAVVCDAAQILGRRRCTRAVPKLAALAVGHDDNVALAAFEAIGRIGGEDAVDLLVSAVHSGNFFRAFPAIDVLGRTGDPRAVAPLSALLNQPHYAIEAARALGRAAQPNSAPTLAALLLKSNDAQVRVAAWALVEVHDRSTDRFGPNRAVLSALADLDASAASRRLTQSLVGADVVESTAICRVLGWLGGRGALSGLMGMLDSDPATAVVAARAISDFGRAAEPFLLAALRESPSERRLLLLPSLSRGVAASPEIIECLRDPHPAVRALACDTIGKIGDVVAIPALFGLLGDTDGRVSQAAVSAIQSLGGLETEQLAIEAAQSDAPGVRRSALRILSYFGWPSGLDLFLEAMNAPDERLRDLAAVGLATIDGDRAVAALVEAASHVSPRTRAAAIRALGQAANSPKVGACLRSGLADSDAWVRYYACQSLSRVNEPGAPQAIRQLLGDSAGHVRIAAIEALARLRGDSALEALHAAAQSKDPDVRRAALLAVGSVRNPSSISLVRRGLSSPDAATRLVALSALAEFGDQAALSGVRDAMGDPDDAVRSAAIGLLASYRGPEATEMLVGELGNPVLRDRVLAALASPVEGRVEGLVAALRTAASEVVPHLVSALAKIRRADASAALEDAFGEVSSTTRRIIAPALAALATASARRLLERASVDDADAQVREVCAALLRS